MSTRRLFISGALADSDRTDELAEWLTTQGHQAWRAPLAPGGHVWWAGIVQHISDCDVFVVIFSDAWLDCGACRRALEWAYAVGKPVLVVKVAPTLGTLPTEPENLRIVDITDFGRKARAMLVDALSHLPVAPPATDVTPVPPPTPVSELADLAEHANQMTLTHEEQRRIWNSLEPLLRSDDSEVRATAETIRERVCSRDDLYADVYRALTANVAPTAAPRPAETGSWTSGLGERTRAIGRGDDHHRPAEPMPSFDIAASTEICGLPDGRGESECPDSPAEPSDVGADLAGTVFAPARIRPGAQFLVQVFAHLPEHRDVVAAEAAEFDPDTHRLGTVMFHSPVLRGQSLTFELLMPGLVVDDPVQSMVWIQSPQAVQFGVTVPSDIDVRTVIGTVVVSRESVPIGQLKFKVSVQSSASADTAFAPPTVIQNMHRFRRAFISYSSVDRAEVLKRTQMLAEFGIDFFQDILTLEPGERWEATLYGEIDRCDAFLLFWSSAAKASEWVTKEWHYALRRQGGDQMAPPEILPVIIEGPPPVPPPAELDYLNFNDRLSYFIKASLPAG